MRRLAVRGWDLYIVDIMLPEDPAAHSNTTPWPNEDVVRNIGEITRLFQVYLLWLRQAIPQNLPAAMYSGPYTHAC